MNRLFVSIFLALIISVSSAGAVIVDDAPAGPSQQSQFSYLPPGFEGLVCNARFCGKVGGEPGELLPCVGVHCGIGDPETLFPVSNVPLPASAGLLIAGIAGLALIRRRRAR